MKGFKFQRSATTRVLTAAPELRYVAYYHADEARLKACMLDYEHRSFVYVLTVDYNGSEHYIYAGKSSAQYARMLNHLHQYAFDHLYLFETEPGKLNQCEAAVIRELAPLYNRLHNPLADRNRTLLGIQYDTMKDASAIHQDLKIQEAYSRTCLFGFALPGDAFRVLEQKASAENLTCSELLQNILEKMFPQEIAEQITRLESVDTNLISVQAYGDQNSKSREQIKCYCRKNRLPGAMRIGRDWVIPKDTRFPKDHRRKGT